MQNQNNIAFIFKGLCITKALKYVKHNDIDDSPQYVLHPAPPSVFPISSQSSCSGSRSTKMHLMHPTSLWCPLSLPRPSHLSTHRNAHKLCLRGRKSRKIFSFDFVYRLWLTSSQKYLKEVKGYNVLLYQTSWYHTNISTTIYALWESDQALIDKNYII